MPADPSSTAPPNGPSPAVRRFLDTLSHEAGGTLPPYGMATIATADNRSTAVVPQWLAVPVWRGLREQEAAHG